jgi:hypothetical protein
MTRIDRLMTVRGMTLRAARTVVDAAMFGVGCVEGEVRERIELEKMRVQPKRNQLLKGSGWKDPDTKPACPQCGAIGFHKMSCSAPFQSQYQK